MAVQPRAMARRGLLQVLGVAAAGVTVDQALAKLAPVERALAATPERAAGAERGAATQRRKRYVMVIDLQKCVACDACTFACKQENHTPPGVYYNVVLKEEVGAYPNVKVRYLPRPCMQCGKPPCVDVCPVGATYKRAEDGIVAIDYDKCIGCRYCMTACPYGARSFDFGENYHPGQNEFERTPSYEYGRKTERKAGRSPIGNVRKCHFCLHRLERGEEPACVQTCMSKARIFGDLSDPDSEVAKLLTRRRSFRLKEELGTDPSVYYLYEG